MSVTYKDLNLAFRSHPGTNDVLMKTDVEAVKTSLRNIVVGNPFDVPFNPHFGGMIRSYLHELVSPALIASLERNLLLKITEFDSRVVVEKINITSETDTLDIELRFYVTGIADLQTLAFSLERTR